MKRMNKKPTKKQLRNAKQVHMGPFVRPVCWSDYDGSYCVCHKCWSCKRKMKYTNTLLCVCNSSSVKQYNFIKRSSAYEYESL